MKRKNLSVTVDSTSRIVLVNTMSKKIMLFFKRGKEPCINDVVYDSKNLEANFNRENDIYYYTLQVGS